MLKIFRTPKVTRGRIWLALAIAIVTDGLQLIMGPFGWVFFDQVLDLIAMVATSYLLGFNLLLLPTFVLELIPMADWLPTWTACVALLASMRKKEQAAQFRSEEITGRISTLAPERGCVADQPQRPRLEPPSK